MRNKIQKKMYTYHIKEMMFVSACKKNYLKFGLCLIFAIGGLVVMILPHVLTTNKTVFHRRHTRYATDLKYILFWGLKNSQRSRMSNLKPKEFLPGQKMFINQKCPYINCYITYSKDTLTNDEDFDAVVFDIYYVRKIDINFTNLTRSPEQLYIFRSSGTPERYPLCDHDFDNYFNWTWTYKLSSDIPHPFIRIYGANNSIVGPKTDMQWVTKMKKTLKLKNKINQKRKAVAWVLTKCKLKSKHQDFIKEMREELKGYNYTIDIYGPCGKNKCPGGSALKCYKMVEKDYFFQIVAEEFLTDDYVTEGIVTAMSHLTIPIVLGPADYSNFLPPGSYINAQTFDMKKLGALIDYLMRNLDMYQFFFDWKKYYYYKVHPRDSICDLCAKLNQFNGTSTTIGEFLHWWDPEYKDSCQRLRLYNMFNPDV